MSERMTNVEYGDVLSSIRRLVEEEAGAAPISLGTNPLPVGSDPLVLTPALRVVAPVEESVPMAPFIEVGEEWSPDEAETLPRVSSVVSFAARDRIDAPQDEPAAGGESADPADEIASTTAEVVPADQPALREQVAPDEDHLREIVRAVIREELQGPLGERITRNIRKLVRAEIHREMLTRRVD